MGEEVGGGEEKGVPSGHQSQCLYVLEVCGVDVKERAWLLQIAPSPISPPPAPVPQPHRYRPNQ